MFKISNLNCWKIRINQEILEEIYASTSVTKNKKSLRLEETAEILAIFVLECPGHGKENSASGPVSLVEETVSESWQKSKMEKKWGVCYVGSSLSVYNLLSWFTNYD